MIHFIQGSQQESSEIIISDINDSLILKGVTSGDIYLEIKIPFNLSKIRPQYRDVNKEFEKVFVFRNTYFKQFDIIELRKKGTDGKVTIGYILDPRIIYESDAEFLFKNDLTLQTALLRAFASLLSNRTSIKIDTVKAIGNTDFEFDNFYPKDILVGIFPFEWNLKLEEQDITELLFNLHKYGFYYLNDVSDDDFQPPENFLQRKSYEGIVLSKKKSRKYIDIKVVSDPVKENEYCKYYITQITKHNSDEISRFYQLYGLVEIFKDLILKLEINEKVNSKDILNQNINGHKLQRLISEIARDNYSVSKFFTKYRDGTDENFDFVYLDIMYFLETCRDKSETEGIRDFPQLLYFLRNIVVHDIQFLFKGTDSESIKRREKLYNHTLNLEYLIIETLTSIDLSPH